MDAEPHCADGVTAMVSAYPVRETLDRLDAALTAKGMTVFARIDHQQGAMEAGMTLRPTELLVFGNAKAGTPLMQIDQRVGIDLPLKMLSWEDEAGRVWLAYNEPGWIGRRHGLAGQAAATLAAFAKTLAELAHAATG